MLREALADSTCKATKAIVVIKSAELNCVAKNKSIFHKLKVTDGTADSDLFVWDKNDSLAAVTTPLEEIMGPGRYIVSEFEIVRGDRTFISCDAATSEFYAVLPTSLREDHPIRQVKFGVVNDLTKIASHIQAFVELHVHDEFAQLLHIIAGNDFLSVYDKATAAKSVHQAYRGGLLEHTYEIFDSYTALMSAHHISKLNHGLAACIIWLHDLGKIYTYEISQSGSIKNTKEEFLFGHVYLSARATEVLLDKLSAEGTVKLTQLQRDLLVHGILAHSGQKEWGSPVVPCIKEAMVMHYLDNMSAKLGMIDTTPHMEQNRFLGTVSFKEY